MLCSCSFATLQSDTRCSRDDSQSSSAKWNKGSQYSLKLFINMGMQIAVCLISRFTGKPTGNTTRQTLRRSSTVTHSDTHAAPPDRILAGISVVSALSNEADLIQPVALVKRLRVVWIGLRAVLLLPVVMLCLCLKSSVPSGNKRSECSRVIFHHHAPHKHERHLAYAVQTVDIEKAPASL